MFQAEYTSDIPELLPEGGILIAALAASLAGGGRIIPINPFPAGLGRQMASVAMLFPSAHRTSDDTLVEFRIFMNFHVEQISQNERCWFAKCIFKTAPAVPIPWQRKGQGKWYWFYAADGVHLTVRQGPPLTV